MDKFLILLEMAGYVVAFFVVCGVCALIGGPGKTLKEQQFDKDVSHQRYRNRVRTEARRRDQDAAQARVKRGY